MKLSKKYKNVISLITCVLSAYISAFAIKVFMEPSNLLSGGVTGVALLINTLTANTNFHIDTSLAIIILNIPLALLCYKSVSKKFTILSCLNFGLTSLFLKICHFEPFFNDIFLNIAFGGFISAISVVIALKGNGSTGGTDFIALYFSNKYNKSVWDHIFYFNILIIIIFGYSTEWVYAGYTIIFQFISTRTISALHTRYERVTLQITTTKANEVVDAYIKTIQHGITVMDGHGGYSKQPVSVLFAVISSYELSEAIECIRNVDPSVIINVFSTREFVGSFYQKPLD